MISFEQFNLSAPLFDSIKRLGYETPTLIQEKAIPSILAGKDVIGESATGSGKTLAFGCGVVEQVVPQKGLQALILTPTRELAEQVKNEIKEIAFHKKLHVISVYGGVAIDPQIDALQDADVVIATPGRLKDHLERGTVDTSKIKLFILDEADRMLDMGFIEDIEDIMRALPAEKQALFFSATFSTKMLELAGNFMNDPVKVAATRMVDPSKLHQEYYDVTRGMKLSLLVHLLKNEKAALNMVFCNTRRATDFVVNNLQANGVRAMALHGGFTQNKRTKAIETFMARDRGVLVCTDVAARGIHIENVSHIYNYDIPADPTDYVHRIGRTARAGEEGKVINLLCDFDYENFDRVMQEHRFKIEKMQKPYVDRVTTRVEGESRGPRQSSFRRNDSRPRDEGFRRPGFAGRRF